MNRHGWLGLMMVAVLAGCGTPADNSPPPNLPEQKSTADASTDSIAQQGAPDEAKLGAPIPPTATASGDMREVRMGGPVMKRARFTSPETPEQVAAFYKERLASIDEEKRTDDTIILNGKSSAGATVALVIESGGEGESGTTFSVAVTAR